MPATALLATSLGRDDEQPNIALAETIVKKGDGKAVAQLVEVLGGRDRALRSDAIKALYEVGYRRPQMIAAHLAVFVDLLSSRNNRMVWGAIPLGRDKSCAVDAIAGVKPKEVVAALPKIMAAVDKGTVITRDHAVKALVKLAADKRYTAKVMPLLHEQLRTCPINQLPMYAELNATIGACPHAKVTRVSSWRSVLLMSHNHPSANASRRCCAD
ncbi:MAG: hypothetical protein IPL52_03920 [Flavobacteriales bacterium]|nr:hypothetical protein [Flavobacteriales bacterium]